MNSIAQTEQSSGPSLGGLGFTEILSDPLQNFNDIFSIAIGMLTIVAGIWFIFLLITGAISYMQSGGDQAQTEAARKKITTAVTGIIVVIATIFIADFVGFLLGFDILNPGQLILSIVP